MRARRSHDAVPGTAPATSNAYSWPAQCTAWIISLQNTIHRSRPLPRRMPKMACRSTPGRRVWNGSTEFLQTYRCPQCLEKVGNTAKDPNTSRGVLVVVLRTALGHGTHRTDSSSTHGGRTYPPVGPAARSHSSWPQLSAPARLCLSQHRTPPLVPLLRQLQMLLRRVVRMTRRR